MSRNDMTPSGESKEKPVGIIKGLMHDPNTPVGAKILITLLAILWFFFPDEFGGAFLGSIFPVIGTTAGFLIFLLDDLAIGTILYKMWRKKRPNDENLFENGYED